MGSRFQSRMIPADDRQTVEFIWDKLVYRSRNLNGDPYSGEIGTLGPISTWVETDTTMRKAVDFIKETHEKGDGAMAVSVLDSKGKRRWIVGGWCPE